ncbi:hypothetical protein A4A58_25310 [Tardiphaga robiniae]|uniref:Uncharacterized protein n=1 Tax=Tardiphaga robiniae TaxID=943830 RepID=A0A163ZVP5_9BRAD|nr:hypothetical protein A4A58_25310 [Tardiphaga robiniae]
MTIVHTSCGANSHRLQRDCSESRARHDEATDHSDEVVALLEPLVGSPTLLMMALEKITGWLKRTNPAAEKQVSHETA